MTGQDLDQLRLVANIVRLGSFTAAAAARGVSQPAVSMQVRALEARCGVRLIERIGRRVHATAAGADLIARLPELERALDEAAQALAPYREGRQGRLRFGTGATFCIYLLPPVLRRLRERLPGLEIVVRTGNTADILRLVEENAIDLALVTLPARGRRLEVTPLLDDALVAIFPADRPHPVSAVAPGDLAPWPLSLYEPGGETRGLVEEWFAAAGSRARPVMELGSVEAMKRLVGAGICAAIVPELALGADVRDVVAAPLRPRLRRTLGIAMRRDKRLDPGLREMLRLLKALPEARRRAAKAGPATGRP